MSLDLDHLLAVAVDAAVAAGSIVRDGFAAPQNVREKHPGDLVSDTDVASERSIRSCARAGGARTSRSSARRRAASAPTSDGSPTRSTAPPTSCTASRRSACRSGWSSTASRSLGVVHAPMLGNLYSARRGGGAFRDGERISVSQRVRPSAICADRLPVPRQARATRRVPAGLRARAAEFEDLRRAGAASLDLAWTAAGVFDGYFEQNLGTWDVAAGGLIVREAGGVVTDWQGDERAWLTSGDIVAGPPAVHERILELIAAAQAQLRRERDRRARVPMLRRKRAARSPSAV